MRCRIAVLGAGAWGTALCFPLAANGNQVRLWDKFEDHAERVERTRRNDRFLPGFTIPDTVHVTGDLDHALEDASIILLAVPTHAIREVSRQLHGRLPSSSAGPYVISAAKGLEQNTHLRMTRVIAQEVPELNQDHIACLSGPNFAVEVAAGQPSATVLGVKDSDAGRFMQDRLITGKFRVYTNPDVAGVELGGSLKNVIAIAVGIAEGMGLGYNPRAALITRGIAEIARLGHALGCNPLTFAGLSGMGDLVLTCTGEHSRNRKCGYAIGRGQSLDEFLKATGLTVEGVGTTRAARELAQNAGIDMPVTEQVYQILFGGKAPSEGVTALMTRKWKHEIEEVAQYR